MLKPEIAANRDTALSILKFAHGRLAPYQKIRVLEFCELPKTVSGKIRRTELRVSDVAWRASGQRMPQDFFETDFPELTSARS